MPGDSCVDKVVGTRVGDRNVFDFQFSVKLESGKGENIFLELVSFGFGVRLGIGDARETGHFEKNFIICSDKTRQILMNFP
jgi:hypothetical protein